MIHTINSDSLNIKKFKSIPKIIVLLSTYNNSRYVAQQIDSIMNQKNCYVKLVIRDDGSTDNTREILLDYKKKYANKIHLQFGKNIGIHKSYHYLYNNFYDSKYLSFADADDIWDTDKLSIAIHLLNKYDASLYAGSSRLIDQNNQLILRRNNKNSNFYFKNNRFILFPGFQGCTLVLKRKLIRKIIKNTSNLILPHDNWIPLVAYFTNNIIIDKAYKMSYRQHDQSWTGNRKKRVSFYFKRIKNFFKGIKRYKILSNEIIKSLNSKISKADLNILTLISKSNLLSSRIKLFLSPSFSKEGLLKNLFFKIYLLFFGL